MSTSLIEKQFDMAVDQWTDEVVDDIKGQGKSMADKAIQSVSNRVQKEFVNKIGDKALREAASGTLKKISSVDGLINAFESVKDGSILFKDTLGEMGTDVSKFLKGEMDRVDLMESMANRADKYISNIVGKMATAAAAEFGTLAPAIGEMAGYIASKMFREAVAPFLNAAIRAKYAKQRYEQLHGFYEEAIAQMQQQRQKFIRETAAKFEQQQRLVDECFNKLDEALSVNDVNGASAALNGIAQGIGGQELQFKTFDDFRKQVKSKKKLVMN